MTIDWTSRLHALDELLVAQAPLWRQAPFHAPRPGWCQAYPALAAHVLGLDDGTVATLTGDNGGVIERVARFVPGLEALAGLIELPRADARLAPVSGHACWHVPGRKQAQIEAFAGALGPVHRPVLEWCAGKGHLGRLLARHWHVPVISLEWDATLCQAGTDLAAKAGATQAFVQGDALAPESAHALAGRHAVALHACGDLHLALLRGAVAQGANALDLAPCCYYRTAAPRYQALNADASLDLSRDELHLAVSETVTAGAREVRQRDQDMAWKLAFLELRWERAGVARSVTFKPVPGPWRALGFAGWLQNLARREGLELPADLDWERYERLGWARQGEVMRLNLVRLAFRRPLEVWLALDRLLFLERRGYRVNLTQFCDAALTPRNLLISARR